MNECMDAGAGSVHGGIPGGVAGQALSSHVLQESVSNSEASSQPPIGFPKPKGKSLWFQALFGINFAGAWSVHGGIPRGVAGVRQGQGRGNRRYPCR